MGKAYRWFRSILGLKKSDSQSTTARNSKEKRTGRWSFVKSYREKENLNYNKQSVVEKSCSLYVPAKAVIFDEYEKDENHHAVTMAEATAAVAEAALATAQAAVAVVRLTGSSSRCATTTDSRHVSVQPSGNLGVLKEFERSAIQIQSVFRGFLARKALRALKGLVKLQALVRGHIERKRTADWLHRVQSLVRAQVRARAGRVMSFDSSHSTCKSSHLFQHDPQTPEKVEPPLRVKGGNDERQPIFKSWDGSKSNGRLLYDEDKLQVAQYRPDHKDERQWENQKTSSRSRSADDDKTRKYKNLFHSTEQYSHSSRDSTIYKTVQSSLSYEVQSMSPMQQPYNADEGYIYKSPFTPTKSDVSVSSYTSGFTDHPNYMSYTESSRAKLRSLSAPKQRPHYEKSSSDKLYFGESRSGLQKISALQANFASKAYPGSGRLDRLGMPVKCIY